MRNDRLGKLMSVFVSVLLGCWLLLLVLPVETSKKQENDKQQPQKIVTLDKLSIAKPLATPTAIVLPAPPAPPKPIVEVEAPKPKPKPKLTPKPKPVAKATSKPTPKPKPKLKPKPKPRSKPVKQVKRKLVPPKVIAPKPQPAKPKPKKPEPTVSLASTGKKGLQEGRALLRVLEHGAGPMIEIAWPSSASQRDVLFKRFSQCFGMRVALVDEQAGLFIDEGQRGRKWDINMDRFSGFLRQPSGGLARNEYSKVQRIRLYHGGLDYASPIRLLLSGLGQIVGDAYKNAKHIRATYRLSGQRTLVDGVTVDGRHLPGTIDLSGAGRRCLRRV